jgi:colanic acid biosynthesis glycosyl transferase WcaI
VRVAVLNQFYSPDLSPTAQMAASLAEHRAALGDDVTVITGSRGYARGHRGDRRDGPDGLGSVPGPKVVRVWHPGLGRRSVITRLADYLAFWTGALARILTLPRQGVIVVMTTPPFLVIAALAHRALHPRTRVVLWSMDCYPDVAERYGTIRRGSAVSRALRACNRVFYRRLAHVVCLDGAMQDLLASQYAAGPERPRFSVIPNWESAALFPATTPSPWPGYGDPELKDRFVVLYQGNLGYGHRYEAVLDAAARLADDEVVFLFVGGGFRRDSLEADAAAAGLKNIVLRPYVPKDQTPGLLVGAGAALILLDDLALGVMSPSKLHSSLAMGVPVLYIGPEGSNVDEAITRFGCGFSFRHDDVDGFVGAVRRLRDDPTVVADLRRCARTAFEEAYTDAVALTAWDTLLGH